MEYNFCRRCGEGLTKKSPAALDCPKGHTTFTAASPAVGVFFIGEDNRVLMSVRAQEPFKGDYDTIGGFVDAGETFEQALEREIEEETGLDTSQYGSLNYLCSLTNIYPYQGEPKDVLSVFFYANIAPEAKPEAQDDVAELVYVDLETIDMERVGAQDVRAGILAMREKLKLLDEG